MTDIALDELVKKLREIRSKENINLKTSHFLRETFKNEYGDDIPVVLRNYQKQGVLNTLMMERSILGDDTGLGKTLSILTTIGYVWLKEPEYVPIIVCTKSALFQWKNEVEKFMQGMEPIVCSGEPYERHQVYEEFFWHHDFSKKMMLLLTYDNIMRDMSASVVKDKTHKPDAGAKKGLVEAKKILKVVKEKHANEVAKFKSYFEERIIDVHDYLNLVMFADTAENFSHIKTPPTWTQDDSKFLENFMAVKKELKDAEHEVLKFTNRVTPPKHVQSILEYITDLKKSHPGTKFMLVMDEMHKLKNHKSQFHEKTHLISLECDRIIGMTATPVKNRLMEFFSLFHIIQPKLFPKITHFQNEYCVMKMQPIPGGRQVPVVVGYKNIDRFVEKIEPYFLSRKKYDVAKELPQLISIEVECELYDVQSEPYELAEQGMLNKSDDPDSSHADILSSLTMCMQACDSPNLLVNEEDVPFDGPSSKVDKLIELLQEDADGQKVIVFSKFEKFISVIEKELNAKKIKNVRVTGKESDSKIREKHKNIFQDQNSGTNVILITMAGSESINLQAAEHFVFMDLPWSWGDYVQLVGRMVRIGSSHTTVCAHHFLATKSYGSSKTIDHHVLKALRSKKTLSDRVSGEALQGGLQFEESDIANDIISIMKGSSGKDKKTLLQKTNEKLKIKSKSKDQKKEPKQNTEVKVVEKVKKPDFEIEYIDIL